MENQLVQNDHLVNKFEYISSKRENKELTLETMKLRDSRKEMNYDKNNPGFPENSKRQQEVYKRKKILSALIKNYEVRDPKKDHKPTKKTTEYGNFQPVVKEYTETESENNTKLARNFSKFGFEVNREPRLSFGRPDFILKKKGFIFVVECKIKTGTSCIFSALGQLKIYSHQIKDSIPVFAYPHEVKPEIIEIFKINGIIIIKKSIELNRYLKNLIS